MAKAHDPNGGNWFRRHRAGGRAGGRGVWRAVLVGLFLVFGPVPQAAAEGHLGDYLGKLDPAALFPGADRLGPVEGQPAAAALFRGSERVGYLLLNAEVVNAIGYSGKPISVAVAVDLAGVIRGGKLVEHHEPIVLIGIPEAKVAAFIAGYIGLNVFTLAESAHDRPPVDLVSGATVSTIVIGESMVRAAIKVLRARGLGPAAAVPAVAPVKKALAPDAGGVQDWTTLTGNGAVRHLLLEVGTVNRAFAQSGNPIAAARPEPGPDDDAFIDLYAAQVSVPQIGRSLLGAAEYQNLTQRLAPGQQAFLFAASGRYSFRGSGFVRGGIFDRIQLVQGEETLIFHDRDYKRLGDLAAAGAPAFEEVGLFTVPKGAPFEAVLPWHLALLVQRQTGALDKAFLSFEIPYAIPEPYLTALPAAATGTAAVPAPVPAAAAAVAKSEPGEVPLWQRLWRGRSLDIGILGAALLVLSVIFFAQPWLVRRPRLLDRVRLGYLAFVLVWLGWGVSAQLSVVNVLTFATTLLADFRWDTFLLDPLVFILWFATAAALLLWGRGAFCGWLCPFGALQEFTHRLALLLRIPQLRVPWGLHERLWAVKYLAFLVLFGLALHSLSLAEQAAEIEPFKTAIILRFNRDWPFVLYAVALLAAGLFIERFYCRYLCPLGAALAIPARLRIFDWLRRYKECGSPCQRCARECMVGAIHPEGPINPNECITCMHCQVLYHHDQKCPVMIQRRLKQERFTALSSPDMLPSASGKPAAKP